MSRPYWTFFDKKIGEFFAGWWRDISRSAADHFRLWAGEGKKFTPGELAFALILAGGLALRGWGLVPSGFVLPEELQHLRQASDWVSSSSTFKFEGTSFYGLLLVPVVLMPMVLGLAAKTVPPYLFLTYSGKVTWLFPQFVALGRGFGLLLFAAALFLLFRLAARMFNERAGWLAALLLAFSPVSTQVSRFVVVGNGALLLLVAGLFALFILREKGGWRWGAAGAAFGLLAATSFHGLFLLPFVFAAMLLVYRRSAAAFALAAAAAAFAGSYYNGLDLPLRFDNAARQILARRDYFHEPTLFEWAKWSASNTGWVAVGASLLALVAMPFAKEKRGMLLGLAGLAAVSLFLFGPFFWKAPEDLIFVLVPCALLAAFAIDRLLSGIPWRPLAWGGAIAVAAAAILPLSGTAASSPLFAQRLRPLHSLVDGFRLGPWPKDLQLGYQPPHDFMRQGALRAYLPEWKPVPAGFENRVVAFVAGAPRLTGFVFAARHAGGAPLRLRLRLWDAAAREIASSEASLPPGKPWRDLVFPLDQKLDPGKIYFAGLDKTSEPPELLFSDKNPFLESAAVPLEPADGYVGKKVEETPNDFLIRPLYVSTLE